MKIISIVGTRPQFLKLAPLSYQFKKRNIEHIVIHSGQHYDEEMSDIFFKVLEIPEPDYLLFRKGKTSTQMISNLMIDLERILSIENPNIVLVYGDCNTTLAGALVAKNLDMKLVHIEAGMRSYNKSMPEETNRVLTDHISDILLCSTKDSIEKLKKENIIKNVHYVGNLQLELLEMCIKKYNNKEILLKNSLVKDNFILMTIHRHYNTTKEQLEKIFNEIEKLNEQIIFPIHPRTNKVIIENNINIPKNIKIIKAIDYLNMTILERYCKYIITDSGGIQPEAWYLGKKCIVLRSETEWIEPIKNNNNILFNWENSLIDTINNFLNIKVKKNNIKENVSFEIINLLVRNNNTTF